MSETTEYVLLLGLYNSTTSLDALNEALGPPSRICGGFVDVSGYAGGPKGGGVNTVALYQGNYHKPMDVASAMCVVEWKDPANVRLFARGAGCGDDEGFEEIDWR